MARLQRTEMKWPRSFPTVVTSPLVIHACTFQRGRTSCKKTFTRQCDLRQHQKNHTRPSKCHQCKKGFPSQKDLERHENSVHQNTVKYFCPHEKCRDFIKKDSPDWYIWGFRRKDHWQKHMKEWHLASREMIRDLQSKGVPVAMLKEGKWVAVLNEESGTVTYDLPRSMTRANLGQYFEPVGPKLHAGPNGQS